MAVMMGGMAPLYPIVFPSSWRRLVTDGMVSKVDAVVLP